MNFRTIVAMACLAVCGLANGQGAYPNKPIRVVVPFVAGAGVDAFGRALAQKMSDQLGQPMVIDNRAGAGGVIGGANVVSSPADGYALLATTDTSVYLTTQVVQNGSFDPLKNLTPVIAAAVTPTVIVVHPSLPVRNVKELIEYAKKSGEPIPYVTAGVGSLNHLAGESLALATGAKFLHVAYKGGAPAMTDLLAGHVKMAIIILTSVSAYIDSGKLRPIAVVENHRSKFRPDIPTVMESGVPGFFMPDTGLGMWAPAGTPPAVIEHLNAEAQKALANPAVKASLEKAGFEITPLGVQASAAQGVERYATYQRLVKETKLTNQ